MGEELDVPCSPSTERTCRKCSIGKYKSWNNNLGPCLACIATCPAGQKITTSCLHEGTVNNNACETCVLGVEYKTGFGDNCTACTPNCPDGQYITQDCTTTTDTVCSTCAFDEFRV